MTSTVTHAHARGTAEDHPRRTGQATHQIPNVTSDTLTTRNPNSRSGEIKPLTKRAGGKDSQSRPTYSSTECAA
jgi:hypothetical protein